MPKNPDPYLNFWVKKVEISANFEAKEAGEWLRCAFII